MSAYLLGNIVGRLFVAYLLVWSAMLFASSIDWRKAFARTHRWYGIATIAVVCCVGLVVTTAAAAPLKRPMHVHKVEPLSLVIWTEAMPEWETRLEWRGGQAAFIAETPALTFPPASMSWVSKEDLSFTEAELPDAARGAIHQIAVSFRVARASLGELRRARYGELHGFELDFSAMDAALPVDVRVFFGQATGRPAVLMSAVTLRGRLGGIEQQIRRSWTNVRYLR